jgi:hypothetical protein
LPHGLRYPWHGLGQLRDVQGWDPGRLVNAQGQGQQLIQLTHGHETGLKEVAPDKSATMVYPPATLGIPTRSLVNIDMLVRNPGP